LGWDGLDARRKDLCAQALGTIDSKEQVSKKKLKMEKKKANPSFERETEKGLFFFSGRQCKYELTEIRRVNVG